MTKFLQYLESSGTLGKTFSAKCIEVYVSAAAERQFHQLFITFFFVCTSEVIALLPCI